MGVKSRNVTIRVSSHDMSRNVTEYLERSFVLAMGTTGSGTGY